MVVVLEVLSARSSYPAWSVVVFVLLCLSSVALMQSMDQSSLMLGMPFSQLCVMLCLPSSASDSRAIKYVDDIEGNDVGWTLGAMIVQSNLLPFLVKPAAAPAVPASVKSEWALVGGAVAMAVFAPVVLWRVRNAALARGAVTSGAGSGNAAAHGGVTGKEPNLSPLIPPSPPSTGIESI